MPMPSILSLEWWLICFPTFLHCRTSSLLAVMMIALGLLAAVRMPTPSSFNWEIVGIKYERVFPDPVGEVM
jgi:hypothetical protein